MGVQRVCNGCATSMWGTGCDVCVWCVVCVFNGCAMGVQQACRALGVMCVCCVCSIGVQWACNERAMGVQGIACVACVVCSVCAMAVQ